MTEPTHPDVRFEESDIHAPAVMLAGGILFVSLLVLCGIICIYYLHLAHVADTTNPAPLPIVEHGRPLPPEPRLQKSPPNDWLTMKKQDQAALDSYRWVDQSHGIVSIPIERAMQLTVEQGIPPQPAPPGFTYDDPRAGDRLTGFEERQKVEPQ